MFNNIGRKIKTLAKVLCWLGIIASVISRNCHGAHRRCFQ